MKSKHLHVSGSWPVPLVTTSTSHAPEKSLTSPAVLGAVSTVMSPSSLRCSQVFPLSSLRSGSEP